MQIYFRSIIFAIDTTAREGFVVKEFLKSLKLNESTLSNALTVLVFVLVGVLIFNYFRSVNKVDREQTSSLSTEELSGQKAEMTVEEVVKEGLPADYTVKQGDSLWKIAERAYGSGYEWSKIYDANKTMITNPNVLPVDAKITLPSVEIQKIEYTVAKGDNLWNIAVKTCNNGFVWLIIATDNHIPRPSLIEPGLKLTIICR